MISEDQKQPDNAETAESLEDREKLVKRIQALSQLAPSAALDAAMLASHKSARSNLLTRLHIPVTMAVLMIAVLAAMIWHQSEDLSLLFSQALKSTSVSEPEQALQTTVQTDASVKEKGLVDTADKNVSTAAMMVASATQAPVVAAKTPVAEARSMASDKNENLPKIVGASAMNDALHRNADRIQPEPVQAQAATSPSKAKVDAADKKAVTAPAPVPVAVVSEPAAQTAVTAVDKAKAWLAAIDVMSNYESRREAALVQLERFEKSYPHYPVPEALRAKLKGSNN
jgi:hypothetical protein